MRISLNLASRPYADLRPVIKRLRIAMVVLALSAIGLGWGLRAIHVKANETRAREQSVDSQIAVINHERLGYQNLMRQPDNSLLLQQVGFLNQLIDEKTFSWTLAMADLETVLPAGVQVSTIEPSRSKDGQISLRLRVIGPHDRSVELVRNLEHSRRFLLPRIVGENSESSGSSSEKMEPVSASNRFNFDLQVDYNPPSNGEIQKIVVKTKPRAEHVGSATAAETKGNPKSQPKPGMNAKPLPVKRTTAPQAQTAVPAVPQSPAIQPVQQKQNSAADAAAPAANRIIRTPFGSRTVKAPGPASSPNAGGQQ
jgi:type IV pilus assembly protein PilN